jgi:hypothetical protein
MEPVKAKLLNDRWDSLTPQQKQMEILKMPDVCHVCGSGGDGMHFMPDPSVGYTKLLCSECCSNRLLQGCNDDDDDDEDYEDDDEARDWSGRCHAAQRQNEHGEHRYRRSD